MKRTMVDTPAYFTDENLVKFLKTYQPKGEYPYDSNHACLIAHFAANYNKGNEPAIVNKHTGQGTDADLDEGLGSLDIGETWFTIPESFMAVAQAKPHTYAAAYERAKTVEGLDELIDSMEAAERAA